MKNYQVVDVMARGGVRRYLDSTEPCDWIPNFGVVSKQHISLTGLADIYGTDKGLIKHRYTSIYERLLNSLLRGGDRLSAHIKIAEIGVACGASLRMWSDYLPAGEITGYDIRSECANLCKDVHNISIKIQDLTLEKPTGYFDLIIDDGSHIVEDIISAFFNCFDSLLPGGFYVIEDLSCTYKEGYAKEFSNRFRRTVKNNRSQLTEMIDVLMRQVDSRLLVESLEYYPQLLVIRKKV